MAAIGKIPVFMRVGDSPETEIGSICPEIGKPTLGPDGSMQVSIVTPSIAEVLRTVADAFEKNDLRAKIAAEMLPGLQPPA